MKESLKKRLTLENSVVRYAPSNEMVAKSLKKLEAL